MTNQDALTQFLLQANRQGYAAGRKAKKIKEADHSTTICYEAGEWKLHDNYFGGEPYGGRMVVFFRGRPVWMTVFYGHIDDPTIEVQPIYTFLQQALLLAPPVHPIRGPDEFSDGSLTYRNAWHGALGSFWGEEQISRAGRLVYVARYAGGFVDQRAGD